MEQLIVPAALERRLGSDAAEGLVEMFGQYQLFATDRFERRLTQEVSAMRIEMYQQLTGVRQDMAAMQVNLLRWSFLFWIGHIAVTLSVMGYMLGG